MIGDSTAAEESKTSSSKNNASNVANGSGKNFGEDGYRYPSLEFHTSQDDLVHYNQSVRERVEVKYETLTKNVHFYLTYLFLEVGDFTNALKHGQIVLKSYEGRIAKKT